MKKKDDIRQFISVEVIDVMIEGERGEDILKGEGDREDQAEVMFEEEMRRLRRNFFWFIAKE